MKKIYILLLVLTVSLCTGCNKYKNVECTKSMGNNAVITMKVENNKLISITETTYDTEEQAIRSENYSKNNFDSEVTREGKKVIDKNVRECDDSCKDAKETYEKMGYSCK